MEFESISIKADTDASIYAAEVARLISEILSNQDLLRWSAGDLQAKNAAIRAAELQIEKCVEDLRPFLRIEISECN